MHIQVEGAEPWAARGTGARAETGILVVHGFTGSPRTTTPFARRLQAAGFTVDVPLLPGHGTSWRELAMTRYRDWRDEAAAGVGRLGGQCARVVVVGLSMGGTLALDLAWERQREIQGVVPINAPVLPREGVAAKLAPLLARVLPWIPASAAGLAKDDCAAGFEERAYDRIPTKAAQSLLNEFPRVLANLADTRVPALVVHGAKDHSVPPANSREIARRLPSAEELVLPGSCHLATVDVDAELLAERVVRFADGLVGNPPRRVA